MVNREVLRRRGGENKEKIRRFSLEDENNEKKRTGDSLMVARRYARVTPKRKGTLTWTRKFQDSNTA